MTDKFEQKNNLILVAYDFSNEAKCALNHANNLKHHRTFAYHYKRF
jgi:hypothetical protein